MRTEIRITVIKRPPNKLKEDTYKRTEIRINKPLRIQNFLLGDFSELPIFIKSDVNTGLITKATNNDEESTMIRVIGRYLKNSPIRLGQNMRGMNAATVVAVDAMIAVATSPVPSLDA